MDSVASTLDKICAAPITSAINEIERSILSALAYADLFEYPLSQQEITRYQIGTAYSGEEIALCLATSRTLRGAVSNDGDFYCLRSRESVFQSRLARRGPSRLLWKRASIYGRWLARLPFVRMVAITGALAVDNIAARPDIDFLVVATERRIWICRRFTIALVRLARLFGDDLCPNYIIAESNLRFEQQDLFTAHELAQMVPLFGRKLYREILLQNGWAHNFLPSGFGARGRSVPTAKRGRLRGLVEKALSVQLFDSWERWELERLQNKLRQEVGDAAEVICSPQQCKGHTGLHRQWVTSRYSQRLSELGL